MSRSYKLNCLFKHNHKAYTIKERWKVRTNSPHTPSEWKTIYSSKLRMRENQYLKDLDKIDEIPQPKDKKKIMWDLW